MQGDAVWRDVSVARGVGRGARGSVEVGELADRDKYFFDALGGFVKTFGAPELSAELLRKELRRAELRLRRVELRLEVLVQSFEAQEFREHGLALLAHAAL